MSQRLSAGGQAYDLPTSSEAEWGKEFANWMRDVSALNQDISVAAYGAVGDGVTDDTAAIQAAIDAATPGTVVYFPRPSVYYKITSSINVTSKTGIELRFSKSSVSGINIYNTYAGAAFKFTGTNYFRIVDPSIRNTDTTNGVGIHL